MRPFNEYEQDLIRKLVSIEKGKILSFNTLLEEHFFTEVSGRALIIQVRGRYAVYFLKTELFDDPSRKKEELERFVELLGLIAYLKTQGYLTLFRGEKTKETAMYFLQDGFVSAKSSKATIVLNARGDYTASPESIHDKNGNVIYKGVLYDGDSFELILSATTGSLIVNRHIGDLLPLAAGPSGSERGEKGPAVSHVSPPGTTGKGTAATTAGLSVVTLLLFTALTVSLLVKFSSYDRVLMARSGGYETPAGAAPASPPPSGTGPSPGTNGGASLPEETATYYGIDISKWNGNILSEIGSIDNLGFVICRATYGAGRDPAFEANWTAAAKDGVIRGAYHFYHVREDPILQADAYLSSVGTLAPDEMPPIVDIEQRSIPSGDAVDAAGVQAGVLHFLDYLERKTGRTPMIYTDAPFADRYLVDPTFAKYPLWIAQYGVQQVTLPRAWKDRGYKIWQKSKSYDVNSNVKTDFDVYVGKKSGLYD